MNIIKIGLLILSVSTAGFFSCKTVSRNNNISNDSQAIITAMQQSADAWNKGDLDRFMQLYDSAATFMMPSGPVGIMGMKENYQKGFFNGSMPKQNLRYDDLFVRPLGKDYALLTGKFTLYGNGLKERSGRYSLVFIHTKEGWKILHDHSS
jgi:ketosteroid isomerase-like protein